jgi:hypothetical protein
VRGKVGKGGLVKEKMRMTAFYEFHDQWNQVFLYYVWQTQGPLNCDKNVGNSSLGECRDQVCQE